jgi:hypothetical protein
MGARRYEINSISYSAGTLFISVVDNQTRVGDFPATITFRFLNVESYNYICKKVETLIAFLRGTEDEC